MRPTKDVLAELVKDWENDLSSTRFRSDDYYDCLADCIYELKDILERK